VFPQECEIRTPNEEEEITVEETVETIDKRNYMIEIEVKDSPVGMDLRSTGKNKLLVVAVRPGGAVDAYNTKVPDHNLTVGDEIQSVNEVSGDCRKMLHLLRTSSNLNIIFRRPVHRVITIGQDKGRLGLMIKRKEDPDHLVIHSIRPDSALAVWMALNPYERIAPGDRIISANDACSVPEMLDTLRAGGDLKLVVAHHDQDGT